MLFPFNTDACLFHSTHNKHKYTNIRTHAHLLFFFFTLHSICSHFITRQTTRSLYNAIIPQSHHHLIMINTVSASTLVLLLVSTLSASQLPTHTASLGEPCDLIDFLGATHCSQNLVCYHPKSTSSPKGMCVPVADINEPCGGQGSVQYPPQCIPEARCQYTTRSRRLSQFGEDDLERAQVGVMGTCMAVPQDVGGEMWRWIETSYSMFAWVGL